MSNLENLSNERKWFELMGELYGCEGDEDLRHESVGAYLDALDGRHNLTAGVAVEVCAYNRKRVEEHRYEQWAESIIEQFHEEFGNPESHEPEWPLTKLTDAIHSVVSKMRVWQCRMLGKRTYSWEEVEDILGNWRAKRGGV